MLVIRCKNCGTNLESHPTKTNCCGCENYTSIRGTNITGNDLSLVEIISGHSKKKSSMFSNDELAYQEARRKRKVKRLDFDVR